MDTLEGADASGRTDPVNETTSSEQITDIVAVHLEDSTTASLDLKTHASSNAVECLNIYDGRVLRRFSSGQEAADLLGVPQSDISLTCAGKIKSAHGYGWRLAVGKFWTIFLKK